MSNVKKVFSIAMTLFCMFAFSTNSSAETIKLDGGKMVDGRTILPLRSIFENLGATVEWDSKTKMIYATRGNSNVELKVNSKVAKVNGKNKNLDVPAKVINGTTFVPVRFISESMGANVEWNANEQNAIITLNNKTIIVNAMNYDKAYATTTLVVKSSPGTSYKTLGQIEAGATVNVSGGVPIGQDQYDWISADQYGWSQIQYGQGTGWVKTHELSFADPFNWVPGIKSKTLNEVMNDYVSKNDKVKLEKSGVSGNMGFYTLYVQLNGQGEWHQVVVINCKTGWYHG